MREASGKTVLVVAAVTGLLFVVGAVEPPAADAQRAVQRTVRGTTQRRLRSFGTGEALRGYVQRLLAAQRADARAQQRRYRRARGVGRSARTMDGGSGGGTLGGYAEGGGSGMTAPAATRPSQDPSRAATGTSAGRAADSITNTQEVGIDEGDIVKVHGEHLVVLRRGRLFTVSLAGNRMQPISAINAFPPDANASEAWYDEMLIDGDTILVIGFSYENSATELGLFGIDANGRLAHRTTYYLRSNDYYSSRNYASRLIGHTLILYMPYSLIFEEWDEEGERSTVRPSFPAMRQWRSRGRDDWRQIVTASEVYQPIQPTSQPVLHTVVTCDLAAPRMQCHARGVVGPYGRTFYVSHEAVYVWVTSDEAETFWDEQVFDEEDDGRERPERPAPPPQPGVVYRLPLAGGAPGALRVFGAPTDQLSLRAANGHLNALLTSEGHGDAMWASENAAGGVALLRVPISRIRPNAPVARRDDYTVLPSLGRSGAVQNRFVGDEHVLYGVGGGWRPRQPRRGPIFVHRYGATSGTTTLELPHGTDRIEPMGGAAVAVGSDGQDLHFTAIELGAQSRIAGTYIERAASQGEERTHGFFYMPTSDTTGYLGLPVRSGRASGARHLRETSASVLFLRVSQLQFAPLGSLASQAPANVADSCVASCVDWYGNARPIFYRNRVYALLGYELVEGRIDGTAIREIGRANMVNLVLQPVARAGN